MSLLSIAQAVAEEIGAFDAPTSIVGSQDRTSRQLLRLINREGRQLAKRSWAILQKENTFTADGSAYVALPVDFGWLLDETVWDRDNFWKMRGSLNASEWQIYKSGLGTSVATRLRFRIKPLANTNKLYFDPTPASGLNGVFEYVSSQWVTNSGGTVFNTGYEADTDVSLLAEELIEMGALWRFKASKGLAYAEEFNEYQRAADTAFARDGGKPILNMGAHRIPDSRINVPQTGFG